MEHALYWNEVAIEANRLSFTNLKEGEVPEQGGPTLGSRALGIIHLAMHDAYKGISGTSKFDFYLTPALQPAIPNLTGIDRQKASETAIAAAAHSTLVALYPKSKSYFDERLNSLPDILEFQQAYQYGCEIATTILELRKHDPGNSDAGYNPPPGRGKHKADPNNSNQDFLGPFYGKSKLFSTSKRYELTNQPFTINGTFNSNDPEYKRAFEQVKIKGIATEQMGTLAPTDDKRTSEESLIGVYWAYDGARNIGTPPRLYNQIVRVVAKENTNLIGFSNLTERNIRLFALVNVAMADAGILAWEEKYRHNLWRPINGIREHDNSMGESGTPTSNFNADCDPFWLPLGAPKSNIEKPNFTPDFPAYPSGHATFGASSLHITRLFFGIPLGDRKKDNLFNGYEFTSDELNGITKDNNSTIRPFHKRKFDNGLWEMIVENALSRIYLGVHWSFDAFKTKSDNKTPDLDKKTGGVDLGISIAEDIFTNGLKQSNT
ncbi:MAG TPA: phosphatase PAP2 family protein [Flavobacterium sp.]|nr:phosphatase PAP2 family protein [Flavobacterium sp.]